MQRSIIRLQQQVLHEQLHPKSFINVNVITLVAPNILSSEQFIQFVQKWTQQLPLSLPPSDIDATFTTKDNKKRCYYNDELDQYYIQSKYKSSSIVDYFTRSSVFNNTTSTESTSNVDSIFLWVGSNLSTTEQSQQPQPQHQQYQIPSITLLHCISPSNSINNRPRVAETSSEINLLAIQSMKLSYDIVHNHEELTREIRYRLSQLLIDNQNNNNTNRIQSTSTSWTDYVKHSIVKWIHQPKKNTSNNLFHYHERLPLLDIHLPTHTDTNNNDESSSTNIQQPMKHTTSSSFDWNVGDLKEIVLPFDWLDTYSNNNSTSNNTTLLEALSDTYQLHRPITGLYQLPNSNICIRPIPMAKEDRSISMLSPTLIFHCDPIRMDEHIQEQQLIANNNESNNDTIKSTKVLKIGYTGRSTNGQLMIHNTNITNYGIHVRLCSATKPTSMFAEAQDSLLASSLHELQSQNVLLSSSSTTDMKQNDSTKNQHNADCWVEFRANLRHPTGYINSSSVLSSWLSRSTSSSNHSPKIAKAPDIPYE